MTTATLKRWALLCLLPILAVAARAETIGIVITAAGLADASGTALPDNRLVQVIANTAGQMPGPPTVSAFVSGADVVLASFALNAATTGVAGAFQIYLTVDRSVFTGLNAGAPLVLRWYDVPYSAGQTAPGAARYGQFTTAATVDGSTSGWTLPSDGQNASLSFVTATQGGSQADAVGRTSLTVLPDAPTVTGVSPVNGPAAGGATVALTGTNFTGATGVSFGGTAGTGIVVASATSLTVTSPAATAGVVDITVTTPGGTSATGAADRYTFVAAPTLGSLSPASGPIAGGTSVTLTGNDFTGATAVRFGATAAAAYTVTSATSITATSPAGSVGDVSVTVTTLGGTSAGGAFTYVTVPTVASPTSTGVASTTATLGGNVSADGGSAITERGVVFSVTSTNANPQLNGTGVIKVAGTGTTGVFTVAATGLAGATPYTYAAYATNSVGTSYSSTGTFTTNPLAPVITSALSASGTYGHAIATYRITATSTPTSYSATGLPPGLSIDSSTGQVTGTPTSVSGSPFSVTIGATNAGGTGTATLIFTVAKAPLTVTADAKTKIYGATNPTLAATITGFVNGETLATSGVTGSPSVTTSATATTVVGTATITPAIGSLAAANYAFTTFTDGALTITKAPLTVTADAQTKVYGAANPVFTATITGFVNGETLATSGITGSPALATTATAATGVGTPAITVSAGTLAAGNYAFTTFVDGTLTITKAPLTVTADNLSRAFGAANPPFTATITGFVNGETLATSGVTGTAAITTTANATTPTGSATLTAAVGTLTSSNYAFTTFVDGTLTITKAALTVTADAQTKVYGADNPTLTATITGFVNGETLATSDVTGSPSVATTATASTGVGAATITPAIGSLASTNYTFGTFTPGTLTITKAPLTVTADAQTKVYGAANPTLTATITGFVNGETLTTSGITGSPSVTTTATAATGVGSATITPTVGSLTSANYAFTTFTEGTLTITKAPLTLTANPVGRAYGAANPAFTATVTGFVNGETLVTSGVTGSATFSTTATPSSAVGTYAITPALGSLAATNYAFATFTDGVLTVGQTPLTITADAQTKVYGADNPTLTATITGFVNGETLATSDVTGSPSVATTATASTGVGAATITPAIGSLASTNYTFGTFTPGTLTITKAPLTVTADAQTKVYGAANPTLTATITGFVNGETLTTSGITGSPSVTTTATAATGVGSATITPTVGSLTSANYAFTTFTEGTLTITKAPLTVTANPVGRAYGAANPAFTATITGFVNGETLVTSGVTGSATFSTTATPSSAVGTYAITPALGSLAATNYAFVTFTDGVLTVGQTPLTITADAQTKVYGAATPALTATITGFVNGETLATSGITGTPSLTTTATAATGVGTATITPTVGSLVSANYAFTTFTPGTLTITKAPLTVTADAQTKVYGAANPTLTATLTGFVNGETLTTSGITGSPSVTTTATAGTGVGTTTITPAVGSLTSANYAFATFTAGTLTITRAPLTLTASSATRLYGAANPALTAALSGFVNGETLATSGITGTASVTTTATALSSVGTYAITPATGSLSAPNYAVTTFVDGTLTVTQNTLTVAGVTVANKVYDRTATATPSFTTATLTGIANGDTANVTLVTTTAAAVFADKLVGRAKPVTISGLSLAGASAANYVLEQPSGLTADITPKTLTVSGVTTTNRIYDATVAAPLTTTGAALLGVVTGDTVALATSGASGTFATKTIGTAKPVTVAGLTLSGADASNYALVQPSGLTADVTPKNLTVTGVTAATRAYDGSTAATPGFAAATLVGIAGSDTVTLATGAATATFASANAGSDKIVTFAGLALAGADAANYTLSQPTATATINPAAVSVTLGNLGHVYDGQPKSAAVSVTPSVATTLVYSGAGGLVPVNAGTYTVTATIADANYTGGATGTLVIAKASQTIAFTLTGTDTTVGSTLGLNANASSGLPVTFAVVSGSAALSGSSLLITSPGTVTVRATQAGDANRNPATADQSFTAGAAPKTPQTIAFTQPADRTTSDAAFTVSATATSGLPVAFALVSGPATLSGNLVSLTGEPGTVMLRASQSGDATFAAAPDVLRSFAVTGRAVTVADTFFGDLVDDTGILGGGPRRGELIISSGPRIEAKAGDIAAVYYSDSRRGTVLIVAPGLNLNVSLDFALDAADAYSTSFVSAGRALTLTGTLSGTTLTGRLTTLGVGFRTQVQARTGSTSAIAGYYQSSSLNSAEGGTATIVGTGGQLLIVATTSKVVTGALGSVAADGTFSVAAPGATLAGSVDVVTTSVTGTIVVPDQPAVSFSGVAATTVRTDRLINLSSRVRIAPAAGRTLITGFVIGGTESKRVLLRAVGPTLAGFGVTDALVNPRLQLFDSTGKVILDNDDWSGAETAAAFSQTGAFALAPGAKDAALIATLAPGGYTMQITAGSEAGVALAEIYDASATPGTDSARLINISTRGTVDSGDGILIGGFVVTGNTPKRVLIRGIGPALAAFGVAGALPDPRLSVYKGATLIAQNDDWSVPSPLDAQQTAATASDLSSAAQSVGAFALSSGTKDAALIVTLSPGAYTAQVASPGAAPGVALVEIYELP